MNALLKHAGTGLAAVLVGLALPAYGNIYSFSTPSGATSSDNEALNATAVFTTSANSIQLVLTNLQSTFSAGQLLADVSFTASGVTGGGGSVSPSSASYINVGDCTPNGGCVGARTSAGAQNLPWTLTNTSGSNYHFTGLGHPAAAGLIIGPSAIANASINGAVHNPYIDGTATFVLALAGVTGSTVISNVSFSFGTGEENSAPGVPVPIPAAVWLFGSGLLGLIGIARRKYSGIAMASPVPA